MNSKKTILPVIIVLIAICIFIINAVMGELEKPEIEVGRKTSMKIGVSIYNQYDTFISSLVSNLTEDAKRKEQEVGTTITLDIMYAGGSQVT
ncbi:MAG: hypothetical protein K0S61_2574, partial [Anaerocolumna sp.]|nr:hypothetical protein [Anaerocolumna sp.]